LRLAGTFAGSIGQQQFPFDGRTVDVFFRPLRSTRWTRVKTAVTAYDGRFALAIKAIRSGTWRVSFVGDASYGPVTGPGIYVHVS
jgi:hypothetical protein